MRRQLALIPAVAAAFTLGACGSGSSSGALDATTPPTSSATSSETTDEPSASAYDGPRVPEGTWVRHLTPEEARESLRSQGVPAKVLAEVVGAFSDDLAFSFKLGDGVWAQYQALDGAAPEVGDSGTYSYDADGNIVTVSESTGCPGCVGVASWTLDDSELTLEVVPGHDEDPVANFVVEGTYQQAPG